MYDTCMRVRAHTHTTKGNDVIALTPDMHALATRVNAAFDTTLDRNAAIIVIAFAFDGEDDVFDDDTFALVQSLLNDVEEQLTIGESDHDVALVAATAIDACDLAARTFGM